MNHSFTIILPVRNGIAFIKECVESILNQTHKNFILIILDNNSNDGTYEWIASLKDERIKMEKSNKDLSIVENWQRANVLNLKSFITFIGHDDVYHSDYLKEMNELINKFPDASIYQTHFNYVNAKGELIRTCKPMHEKIFVKDFLKGQFLQTLDSMGTGYMFRVEDFNRVKGFQDYPNLIFSDYQLWVELTGISYLAVSEKNCFDYRIHNSLSKITNAEPYRIAFEKYIYFLHDYMQHNIKVKEVIHNYAYYFIMYMCESLSHRLLKSGSMGRIKVAAYIAKCHSYAQLLEIKQSFHPNKKFKIWIASVLDKTSLSRNLFKKVRRFFFLIISLIITLLLCKTFFV